MSYLLLCNKLSPNSAAWNIYVTVPWVIIPNVISWLPPVSMSQEVQSSSEQGLLSPLKVSLGRKILFQTHSSASLGLSLWTFHEAAAWCRSWPPLEWVIWETDRNWGRQAMVYSLTSEMSSHHFYCRRESVSPAHTQRKGLHESLRSRRQWSLGIILETVYPSSQISFHHFQQDTHPQLQLNKKILSSFSHRLTGQLVRLALSVQFSSVAQSCPTLYNPVNRSMPGLPVHHQLPEPTHTHVHWISDAIQLSHPLLSPSPPALNLSPHQDIFQWVSSLHQVAKVFEFQPPTSVLPMNTQDWSPLGWTDWISLPSKGLSRVFSNTTVQKHQFFGTQLSSQSNSHIHTWLLEKP